MSDSNPSPPRLLAVQISITDQRGRFVYRLSKCPPRGDQTNALLLSKAAAPDAPAAIYEVRAFERGELQCTCPGFAYHAVGEPCKHILALQALAAFVFSVITPPKPPRRRRKPAVDIPDPPRPPAEKPAPAQVPTPAPAPQRRRKAA
jgi:hypothetical protein